jgi:hypothetical protein
MGKRKWPKTRMCVVCGDVFTVERRPGAPPITCSSKCQKKRRNTKIAEWRARTECPPEKHGLTGYTTYQCDCDVCREAERIYMQERREKQRTARETAEWEEAGGKYQIIPAVNQ